MRRNTRSIRNSLICLSLALLSINCSSAEAAMNSDKPLRPSPSSSIVKFVDLKMITSHIGWAVGTSSSGSVVLRTNNGAHSWSIVSSIFHSPVQLSALNSNTAAVLPEVPPNWHPQDSRLFITHTAGRHWSSTELTQHGSPFWPSAFTMTPQGAWVVGDRSFPDVMPPPSEMLLHITNQGALLNVGYVPSGAQWIQMEDRGCGLLWCGDPTDALLFTSNMGRTWTRVTFSGFPFRGSSVSFPTTPHAFMGSKSIYLAYYSPDTGDMSLLRSNATLGVWTQIAQIRSHSPQFPPSIFMATPAQWWYYFPSEPHTLWRTINSGASWRRERTNVSLNDVSSIQFVSSEEGFGILSSPPSSLPVATSNGGVTWEFVERSRVKHPGRRLAWQVVIPLAGIVVLGGGHVVLPKYWLQPTK